LDEFIFKLEQIHQENRINIFFKWNQIFGYF